MSNFNQRTVLLFGEEGTRRLENAHVLVAGLGAVGSFAVEGLARAGVGKITVADFDVVSETNINRQIFALHSTVGQRKTALALARIKDINPACEVTAIDGFIYEKSLPDLFAGKPDAVIDAIDTIDSKLALIAHCTANGIPIYSSMGAARKKDTTRVHAGTIDKVTYCPLARRIRIALKKMKITKPVECAWSDEPPVKCDAEAEEVLGGMKRRPFGSLCTVTGVFGLTLANLAINHIVNKDCL